ncbi:F420-dependent biliverdin reductase [soil metagenome]
MTTALTAAALEFVDERHLAVLSTFDKHGRIHAVPVGFTVSGGVLRVITSDGSQKVRNVERDARATVCQVDGARWITFIGRAQIMRDPVAIAEAVDLYARRYRQPRVNPRRVVITFTIEDVLGSSAMKG